MSVYSYLLVDAMMDGLQEGSVGSRWLQPGTNPREDRQQMYAKGARQAIELYNNIAMNRVVSTTTKSSWQAYLPSDNPESRGCISPVIGLSGIQINLRRGPDYSLGTASPTLSVVHSRPPTFFQHSSFEADQAIPYGSLLSRGPHSPHMLEQVCS